ncbi:hypothetical protein HDV03_002102 [Kappamyces sp. JEL0829]|nr:hypothetical protein HDV03_002102 [Kappamyces sp. JEL0829]
MSNKTPTTLHYPLAACAPSRIGATGAAVRATNPRTKPVAIPGETQVGVKEREQVHTGSDAAQLIGQLKKENFGLKMRIYYLQQNAERLTPAGMHQILLEHAELTTQVEDLKQRHAALAKAKTVSAESETARDQLRACEDVLRDTTEKLDRLTDEKRLLLQELKTARKLLKMRPRQDLAFLRESLQLATLEIDVLTLAVYEHWLSGCV